MYGLLFFMVIRVLLRAFEQAYILSFLCTDSKALFCSLYKATEKLRLSVMEISGYLCSLSECHIQKKNQVVEILLQILINSQDGF